MENHALVWACAIAAGALMACADQSVSQAVTAEPAPTEGDIPEGEVDPDPTPAADAGTRADVDAADGSADAALRCTSSFGNAITPQMGRLDGTVRAVVVPGDPSCPSDDDHVIVQVDALGSTYAVSVNVQSSFAADPNVRMAERAAPLLGGPWQPGWHSDAPRLDYAFTLGMRSSSGFVAVSSASLATRIAQRVKVGARASAFGDGFTNGSGAHKVHRNGGSGDGALVIDPSGSPTYLLFHFSGQLF